MPIIAAASVSCATARIDLPWRVDRTNHVSTSSTGITTANTAMLFHWIATPPISIASVRGMKFGTEWKLGP